MRELEIEDAERVSDEVDRACKIEQRSTQESVDKVLRRIEKAPDYFDGRTCVECGSEIPEARLKTGAFRDIECQSAHELRNKNHRSHYE